VTRIGLIEDNIEYRDNLAFLLRREGFEIVFESDGHEIDRTLAQHPCDLILLDLGLPDEDGLSIARRLRRQNPALGIVMLTARGSLGDRLAGLNEGTDAYLVKPVDILELAATLNAVQRRLTVSVPLTEAWVLMVDTLTIRSPAGEVVSLTVTETELIKTLASAAPKLVSRDQLSVAMGRTAYDEHHRWVEVTFSRLRKKIETATASESPIRAARGRGYLFAAPIRVVVQ
jgi:DNA-binding response OmpR family regulator